MTKDEFNDNQRSRFKQAIATVAGVKVTDVTIDKITEMSRRVTSIRVDSSVAVTGAKSADSVQKLLTADAINAEISKVGLPNARMLDSTGQASSMLGSTSQAGSIDGGVPSFPQSKSASGGQESVAVIGGVVGTLVVCCTLASFFYLRWRRNLDPSNPNRLTARVNTGPQEPPSDTAQLEFHYDVEQPPVEKFKMERSLRNTILQRKS
jgi:hypothetical protein